MYTVWYLFHDPRAHYVVSFRHDLGYPVNKGVKINL